MSVEPQRPQRQDTYDLRDQIHADGNHMHAHADAAMMHQHSYDDDRSLTEDEDEDQMQMQMEGEEVLQDDGFIDEDDDISSLSVPNESIDFDMVYAFHSFAATVEGQANVVKGDSLYLMDDTNSYWWLVRVLKTQEVGYIPAENIETPFERLARLNKHRNVDLSKATEIEEREQQIIASQNDRPPRHNIQFGNGPFPFPYPSRDATSRNNNRKSIHFNVVRLNHRFIPTLRDGEEEDETDEWLVDDYEELDEDLIREQEHWQRVAAVDDGGSMERDGAHWDDSSADLMQDVQLNAPEAANGIPESLQPAASREAQEYHRQRMQQQQQEQMRQQEINQQRIMQQQQQQAQQAQQQQQQQPSVQLSQGAPADEPQREVRSVASRERLAQEAAAQAQRPIDPADVTETRKMTVTPTIAREYDEPTQESLRSASSLEEERLKRLREDDNSDESLKRKVSKSGKDSNSTKLGAPVSSATYGKSPGKLRKEPSGTSKSDTEDEGKDGKKKKGSVFGSLFGRGKKDKDKGKDRNGSIGSMESTEYLNRGSEDSGRSAPSKVSESGSLSPTTMAAQQQQQAVSLRNAVADLRAAAGTDPSVTPATPERSPAAMHQVSEHASVLRERDEKQQNLYKQYLNRSPSSPPEAQPSYGLQSASSMMLSSPSTNSALGPPTPRPRPGSLILTSLPSNDPRADLSVIRVFAGSNVQTEATFKTVLLNSSTTASDLVKQAIQRFRLPSGEDANDYYLTVKQVERGDTAVLQPQEHPLVVFDTLVVEAMELPKVKRSSVGSISSVSSNLSMHPAIKNLSMNDFTDDSAVKFYLNRKGDDKSVDGVYEGDETLDADISHGETDVASPKKSAFLTVASPTGYVPPERFTSPSIRFAVQLVIYAEDLPDDMQFHPQTEAIVLKRTLSDPHAPVLVSPVLRRKIFMFPKNITVAEVTEIGLERFGIQDGVIDGGDEVEDKTTKRRSGIRVRYCLMASVDGQERELTPSNRIIDAFPRAPQYKAPEKQPAGNKRRSLDASNILGSVEDISPEDPVFVLRRATHYRNSTSRRRSSAPLDEIALQHLHRESTSSFNSEAQQASFDGTKPQPTRAEIIAAQREATRATQRAIVSAQTNSVRGMDVLLPGNAVLRSARYDTSDRIRYSYVEPDGESYDISEIMEQEWRELEGNKNDLLEGVFNRNKDGIGEKLDRVLHKIRKGKGKERGHSMTLSLASTDSRRLSTRSTSVSEYSVDDDRVATPTSPTILGHNNKMVAGGETWPTPSNNTPSRPGTTTPTSHPRTTPSPPAVVQRNPSIAAVLSDQTQSGRGTPGSPPANYDATTTTTTTTTAPRALPSPNVNQNINANAGPKRPLVLPKDDFGISEMMAIIASKAALAAPPESKKPLPPLDPVDAMLFGRPIDQESLHPAVREIYAPAFKQLEEIEKVLDAYITRSAVGAF